MKRLLLVAALGAISVSACAKTPETAIDGQPPAAAAAVEQVAPAAGSPDARAVAAIERLNPQVKVEHVGPAPLPGFREAVVGGQVVYVSDDGRYLFLVGAGGALVDSRTEENLTESALAGMRNKLLATIPASERIVFVMTRASEFHDSAIDKKLSAVDFDFAKTDLPFNAFQNVSVLLKFENHFVEKWFLRAPLEWLGNTREQLDFLFPVERFNRCPRNRMLQLFAIGVQ